MTPAPVSPISRHHTERPDGPSVSISMHGDDLVARITGPLDVDATRALVSAVEGAVRTGSTVAVDLGGDGPLPAASEVVTTVGAGDADGHVTVRAAGYVQLAAGESFWMIDLAGARMCRGAKPIDPSFVAGGAWTAIRAVWLTDSSMHALTTGGDYLSRSVAWTFDR